jgi:hypothetical protein
MTRRDNDDTGQDHLDGEMSGAYLPSTTINYYRLRSLELAVKAMHPDDAGEPWALIRDAETLLAYVTRGIVPEIPKEKDDEDDQGYPVDRPAANAPGGGADGDDRAGLSDP